jgi:hypothetical protein
MSLSLRPIWSALAALTTIGTASQALAATVALPSATYSGSLGLYAEGYTCASSACTQVNSTPNLVAGQGTTSNSVSAPLISDGSYGTLPAAYTHLVQQLVARLLFLKPHRLACLFQEQFRAFR